MSADDGLRPLFRSHLPEFFWTSVETGGTERGVPDSWWLAPGGLSGWIEFKATDGWSVGLRPEQHAWLSRCARMGGRAHVAVRRRGDQLYLFPASLARTALQGGLRAVAPACTAWTGGPARWDWRAVAALLTA